MLNSLKNSLGFLKLAPKPQNLDEIRYDSLNGLNIPGFNMLISAGVEITLKAEAMLADKRQLWNFGKKMLPYATVFAISTIPEMAFAKDLDPEIIAPTTDAPLTEGETDSAMVLLGLATMTAIAGYLGVKLGKKNKKIAQLQADLQKEQQKVTIIPNPSTAAPIITEKEKIIPKYVNKEVGNEALTQAIKTQQAMITRLRQENKELQAKGGTEADAELKTKLETALANATAQKEIAEALQQTVTEKEGEVADLKDQIGGLRLSREQKEEKIKELTTTLEEGLKKMEELAKQVENTNVKEEAEKIIQLLWQSKKIEITTLLEKVDFKAPDVINNIVALFEKQLMQAEEEVIKEEGTVEEGIANILTILGAETTEAVELTEKTYAEQKKELLKIRPILKTENATALQQNWAKVQALDEFKEESEEFKEKINARIQIATLYWSVKTPLDEKKTEDAQAAMKNFKIIQDKNPKLLSKAKLNQKELEALNVLKSLLKDASEETADNLFG